MPLRPFWRLILIFRRASDTTRASTYFKDFLDVESDPLSRILTAATTPEFASRWNRRLAKASHALGPVGSLYDELYFQYCQRLGSSPAVSRSTSCGAFPLPT